MENVSWNDVQEFIRKASALTGLGLRLPTAAEWEFAARGGSQQQRWAGTDDVADLGDYAWFNENSSGRTHPVCTKRPTTSGLCDMSGNVSEWVSDWLGKFHDVQSENEVVVDPKGPELGQNRVHRGGGLKDVSEDTMATRRHADHPNNHRHFIGFRLALSPEPK